MHAHAYINSMCTQQTQRDGWMDKECDRDRERQEKSEIVNHTNENHLMKVIKIRCDKLLNRCRILFCMLNAHAIIKRIRIYFF